MISLAEAKRIISTRIPKPKPEMVLLKNAVGRTTAREIKAAFPQPRFTNSAMDGFAVRWQDTVDASPENPVRLKLVGSVKAGLPANIYLKIGESAQCMTGAPLPSGSDAVIMVENTSGFKNEDWVEIYQPAEAGLNVRVQGEEIREGEVVIPAGVRIGPAEIGVLATFGYGNVTVNKRPRVAVFATGDELVSADKTLQNGQIHNSNLPLLVDLVQKAGASLTMEDVIPDNRSAVKEFLTQALDSNDIIVTAGGVSMGRFDYIREILAEVGIEQHFWKVAQKPGKPLFVGSRGRCILFGLPGNPISAFIGFMEYIWPTIEQWMGGKTERKVPAALGADFPRDTHKTRFLFGKAYFEATQLKCISSKKVGSHMLTSALDANCIIEVEPGEGPLKTGEKIKVSLLPWKEIHQK